MKLEFTKIKKRGKHKTVTRRKKKTQLIKFYLIILFCICFTRKGKKLFVFFDDRVFNRTKKQIETQLFFTKLNDNNKFWKKMERKKIKRRLSCFHQKRQSADFFDFFFLLHHLFIIQSCFINPTREGFFFFFVLS